MKLFLKISISFILVVLILGCLGAGMFWLNWNKNAPAEAVDVKLNATELKIGEAAELAITVQTPWYREITDSIVMLNDQNAALTDEVEITRSANLSGNLWILKTGLIPFEEGEFKDLKVIISLSPDREKKQKELIVAIPAVKVSAAGFSDASAVALKDNMKASELLSFGSNSEEKPKWWLWPIISASILLIIALIILSTQKGKTRVISPWEMARNSLAELKKELTLNDETFFVRLSDILRQYIERRFALPATEKTSEEFIQQLRSDSVLSEKQRIALERFLGTADMVKFAKMNADEKQRNECLNMADNFVSETIPQPTEGGK